MAGHSKWANIKHRKAAQDAKRGKVFTKIIRELSVAARAGGASPDDNPRLRSVIDKALGTNMSRDTIDRAIARGTGDQAGAQVEEITYEGYGPGGVAVLVECMTDNRNRTVSELRYVFNRLGGNLGTTGSVAYLFSRKGQIILETAVDEEQILEATMDAGLEDVIAHEDGSMEIITEWTQLVQAKETMQVKGIVILSAEVTMMPTTRVPVVGVDEEKILRLIDQLEDLDDVQKVYTNADIC